MSASKTSLQASTQSVGFTVDDLDRSIRFYTGLGFEIDQRWESDGKLNGVMLKAGNVQIAVGQDDWKKGRNRTKGVGMRIWIATAESLEDISERARVAGVSESKPYEAPWGKKVLDLTDPDGFALTFSNG
jgi:catechol 2,3-dioxygenase-like lactoylglutathione lyase family enzyme